MTTKTIKAILFGFLMSAMIIPFSGMSLAEEKNPAVLEDATPEEIAEYNEVGPLLQELYDLDTKGKELYKSKQSLTESDVLYLENSHKRIIEIRDTLAKKSAEQREKYAMDKETETKFNNAQNAVVDSGIEFSFVTIDTKNKKLVIAVPENQAVNKEQIKNKLKNIIDVPFDLKFADFVDTACSTRQSNCDPIVGGIMINNNCSIALPVIRNVFWWTEDGFLTAGHCTSLNASIYQPSTSYAQDGTVTKWQNGGSCDCAFVDETGSASLSSAVWWSSTSSLTVTAKMDPLVNDYVYMVGQNSGAQYGKVISVSAVGGSPTISGLIQIDWFASQPGDSGGAIINAVSTNVFHGIVKGNGGGDTFASKWSNIDAALDLQ